MTPQVISLSSAGSTAWIPVDYKQNPYNISLALVFSNTPTLTCKVEYTLDNIFNSTVTPTVFTHTGLTGITTNTTGSITSPVRAIRLTVTSWTSGTVTLTALQGVLNPQIYVSSDVSSQTDLIVDPIKSVTISGGHAYLRYAWNSTLDALHRISVYRTDPTINGPVDSTGVRTIPIATANNNIITIVNAYTAGTLIAPQGDSSGPLYYNSSFIGANHGPSVAHSVTHTAHGKTAVDIGSEWNGPSGSKHYIIKIVDQNTLWLVSNNSGTLEKWNFYATSLSGQTLTHSFGATSTTNIVISADATQTQILPNLIRRYLQVEVDNVAINHLVDGLYYPQKSFRIFENYSICNPAAMVNYLKDNVGESPAFNDDSIYADCDIRNIHSFQSNGCHILKQSILWNSATSFSYQGVLQDNPPVNVGVLNQYVPGVIPIGGADYKALVDITSSLTAFDTPLATWSDAANPPNRMAQITKAAGVNKYGIVLGFSPLTGIGTRNNRIIACSADAMATFSGASKKQYPQAVSSGKQPQAKETYTIVGYHHVYNAETVPDATVATWFVDDNDVIIVLDFHKTSELSRVILPAFCNGWSCSLIDSQNVTLLSNIIIDSGGVAVACTATYGYAIIRVAQ